MHNVSTKGSTFMLAAILILLTLSQQSCYCQTLLVAYSTADLQCILQPKTSDNSSANISIKVSKTKQVNKVRRQTLRPKNHDHAHVCACLRWVGKK